QARMMQAACAALAPVGLYGISRLHRAMNAVLKPKTITCIKGDGWVFRYPSGDDYWNRMLGAGFEYEPEIDYVLRTFSHLPWALLDLGANFGYWSARAGGGVYGERRTIAVEASAYCLDLLRQNAAGLP